jgi:hypothetical protein
MGIAAKDRRPGLIHRNNNLGVGTRLPQRAQAWGHMNHIAEGTSLYRQDSSCVGEADRGAGAPKRHWRAFSVRIRFDHVRES